MVAVLTTLVLVGISLLLVRRGALRLERAAEVARRVGTDDLLGRADALRASSEALRDAVAARDHR